MKKQISIFIASFILLLSFFSCDSLWQIEQKTSVAFNINLQELTGSDLTRSSLSRAVVPGDDDYGDDAKVVVSLHKSTDDTVIESKTLSIEEAQNANIVFENVAIRQSLYAKIVMYNDDGGMVFRARSLATTIKAGENVLTAKANVLFLNQDGELSLSRTSDSLDIENDGPPGLKELQFAYDYMSIDGKLLPDATVYVNTALYPKENEVWNLPGLTIKRDSFFSVIIESIDSSLTIYNMTFDSNGVDAEDIYMIMVGGNDTLNLGGDVHIDRLFYTADSIVSSSIRVTQDLSAGSRIGLEWNSNPAANMMLVEKAGGNFTRDNFIVQGLPDGLIARINDDGDLVVADESSDDVVTYTVTFDANEGELDHSLTKATVEEGKTLTSIPTPTRDGYIFGSWNTKVDGSGDLFTNTTPVTKDLDVFAQWTEVQPGKVVVTFDANGGSVTPASKEIEENTAIGPLPDPSREGYTFEGWNTKSDGTGTVFTSSTLVTENITVYAKWTINSYTVTFNINEGAGSNTEQVVDYNDTAALPADPTRTGYTFDSWNTKRDGTGTVFTPSTLVTGDIEVFAQWTIKQYTITFNTDGGSAPPSDQPIDHNGSITLPTEPIKEGFTFEGWFTELNGGGTEVNASTPITSSFTVYAHWEEEISGATYTVTFISDGATTSGTVTTQTTVNGKIASLPIPEETGYTLVGWYTTSNLLDQDENTAFTSSSVVTGDMSVYTWWILDTSVQNNLKNAKLTLNETGDSFSLALTGSFSGNTYDAPAEYQGKNITKISENGFSGYAVIETIRLRNTITEIGANAFSSLQTWATVSAVNGQGTLAGFSSTENSITAEFATWKEIPADTVVYPIWQ